jgi:hypothetical protein
MYPQKSVCPRILEKQQHKVSSMPLKKRVNIELGETTTKSTNSMPIKK